MSLKKGFLSLEPVSYLSDVLTVEFVTTVGGFAVCSRRIYSSSNAITR